MGGRGSGRTWHWDARETVEDYRSIDVRRWQREGYLFPGNWFGWQWSRNGEKVAAIDVKAEAARIVLSYRVRPQGAEEWESIEEPVPLVTTPCAYGGVRVWFQCPLVGCGRRVAKLYLGPKYFGCRHCYKLVYACTRESDPDRWTRRADKIRDRLGWEPGILNGPGDKPKWMRWKTYLQLRVQHNIHVSQSLAAISQRFGMDIDI